MKVVTTQEMRKIEESCIAHHITTDQLMERAGLEVAKACRRILGSVAGKRILVLIGPGNNGSDGLVTARYLARWGATIYAYIVTQRPPDDVKLDAVIVEDIKLLAASADTEYQCLEHELNRCHMVIDAVLGTGTTRPLDGTVKQVMSRISNRNGELVALDLPTGVNPDTGQTDPASPKADFTISLGFPKVGLYQFPAAENVGQLEVADIGIPAILAKDISLELLTRSWVKARMPTRRINAHKGDFGHALLIGGSLNYPGAISLAAQAALRSGPGLVTLAAPQKIQPMLASTITEAIHLPVPDDGLGILAPQGISTVQENLSAYSSIGIGCGMGRANATQKFIEELLMAEPSVHQPTVIDADGLRILSHVENWWDRLKTPAILTPHPGEMSDLTGIPTSEIQTRRIEVVKQWAKHWGTVVVLKGAFTVVAGPTGKCWINPFANPLLATGGTGDVLTGIIAGFLAQGISLEEAACCGIYIHAASAEKASGTFGDRGATAGDLLKLLPSVTRSLMEM